MSEKFFLITHSAQSTPYASTTETADYLIKAISGSREREKVSIKEKSSVSWLLTSKFELNGFCVLGYSGVGAEDHLRHLRNIGDAFFRGRELSAKANSE